MKISMEVGVIVFMRYHKMINGSKLLIFSTGSCDFGHEDFFRTMGPHGTLGHWDPGTLGHWDTGTLGPWDTGTLGHWDPGTLGPVYECRYPLGTPLAFPTCLFLYIDIEIIGSE